MTERYGGTASEWRHFGDTLGLTAHLLPVVSNPNARLSPRSTVQAIGKVPSRYDSRREVVGIPCWTRYTATDGDVTTWSREPDFGICLQARSVRAIDVDIPDAKLAAAVDELIMRRLDGKSLPRRERANSSKFLLALTMPGEYRKRVITLPDESRIEFLACGQQFIAAGTHPSGARYEWRDRLPREIPTLQSDEFEALWSALLETFGIETRGANMGKLIAPAGQHELTIGDLREMLRFVVGNSDRDHWVRVLWALRSAWRESIGLALDEAAVLQLADEYSQRGDTGRYRNIDDVRKRFEDGDQRPAGGVTWRTLSYLAREGGWRPTVQQEERMRSIAIPEDFVAYTPERSVRALYGID